MFKGPLHFNPKSYAEYISTILYPILIHVGPHKTATSFLQECIFMPENGFQQVASSREVISEVILANPDEYPSEGFVHDVNARIEIALKHGLTPVISDEFLYCVYERNPILRSAVADRMKFIAPNARIIMGIREQRSHLISVYCEYVRGGGRACVDTFLEICSEPAAPLFDIRGLKFDISLRSYNARFGATNVCVLPFELLKNDSEIYLQTLFDFCGVRLKKG